MMENQVVHNETNNEKPSVFKVIWKPAEQFEKVRQNPVIWIPLLIVLAISAVGMFMRISAMDFAEISADVNVVISDEMGTAMGVFFSLIAALLALILTVLSVLVSAAIYMIISKIAKKEVSFKQIFSMCIHINIIYAIGTLFNGIIVYIMGDDSDIMFTSLAYVLDPDNKVFAGIELFSIWGMLITPIALQKVGKYSKNLSWGVAIGFFLIGLFLSYLSMVFSAFIETV